MTKAEDILARVRKALRESDRDILSEMELPQYHIVCTRPVKIQRAADGGVEMMKFDWETGGYVPGDNLWADVFISHGGDTERVTEDEFIQYVEQLRGRRLKGEGTVYTLYEIINAIEDGARAEGRRLTDGERETVTGLRRKTHGMFEKMINAEGPRNK